MTHAVCHAWMHLEHDEPQKKVKTGADIYIKKKGFEIQIKHYIQI